jgi:subtilisin family serine protease
MRRRPKVRLLSWTAALAAAVVLAPALPAYPASMTADPAPTPAAGDPVVQPNRGKPPKLNSSEYRRSWGLETVDAGTAVRSGASGRGVVIGLIDCGLEDAQPEVRVNLSPASTDIIAKRAAPPLGDRHGVYVAGPLGSAFDKQGLLGVAYNATLLSIRADLEGGFEGRCAFRRADLALALDYAVAHGARIVVLPVQARNPLGPAFEAALKRATDAGLVIVAAAGNGGDANPSWPGRYAADPRYAGSVLAVGATDYDGVITNWSNRAGAAGRYFLAAPGEHIITDCGKKVCILISGTSFATPYVAGALALVMELHPELTGPQAAEAVLRSARDRGEHGADAVYGRGVLDIDRAVAPAAVVSRSGTGG